MLARATRLIGRHSAIFFWTKESVWPLLFFSLSPIFFSWFARFALCTTSIHLIRLHSFKRLIPRERLMELLKSRQALAIAFIHPSIQPLYASVSSLVRGLFLHSSISNTIAHCGLSPVSTCSSTSDLIAILSTCTIMCVCVCVWLSQIDQLYKLKILTLN